MLSLQPPFPPFLFLKSFYIGLCSHFIFSTISRSRNICLVFSVCWLLPIGRQWVHSMRAVSTLLHPSLLHPIQFTTHRFLWKGKWQCPLVTSRRPAPEGVSSVVVVWEWGDPTHLILSDSTFSYLFPLCTFSKHWGFLLDEVTVKLTTGKRSSFSVFPSWVVHLSDSNSFVFRHNSWKNGIWWSCSYLIVLAMLLKLCCRQHRINFLLFTVHVIANENHHPIGGDS